jgi:hypothetical protein
VAYSCGKENLANLTPVRSTQLGENDRTLMEITVVLKAKLEAGSIQNSQITQLIQCLTKLGLIPQTRQAVKPEPAAAPDEWDLLDAS